jgi:uncharacterized protein
VLALPDEPKDGLDRRDFIIATIASGAAAATLAATTSNAHAQGAAAPIAGPIRDASRGTVYTGDVIHGKKVISALDVRDLEPGKHFFYFQGVQAPTGQHWYVSATVAKGAKPGKRVLLTSGVHGDEISSVHAIQTIMSDLDPAAMSGTVIAVPDISRPALEGMARRWPNSGLGIDLIDMNRQWPGNEEGASAPSRHAGLLFNRLFKPNADYAIDFHTAATGMDATAFHLARMDLPEVRAMAELYPINQIFDNPAYPTLLANAFIDAGIPAFTPEIGAPRILDHAMVPLFVEGTMNVLKHHGVIAGQIGRTGHDTRVFVANSGHTVLATHGGFVELLVKLNNNVAVGQRLAIQRNTFGEVVAEYTSSVAGKVVAYRTDATAEPGTPLVFIFYNSTSPEFPVDYVE